MRRPLSIMRAADDWIEVLYKIVGEGLHLLARKQLGDAVSLLGPIGQPFVLHANHPRPLLIGGGVGIPPMIFLADAIRKDAGAWKPVAILGSEIPFPFDLEQSALNVDGIDGNVRSTMPLLEHWGVPARLTSLQGYEGCHEGYVTDLAERWLQGLGPDGLGQVEIFACGPTPMLKAVAALAARFALRCQVSLEEYMACAVGGCAGPCSTPPSSPGRRTPTPRNGLHQHAVFADSVHEESAGVCKYPGRLRERHGSAGLAIDRLG